MNCLCTRKKYKFKLALDNIFQKSFFSLMASESSLKRRKSLVWETRAVSKNQIESPIFTLMDTKWTLQVNPVYGTVGFFPSSYNIKLKSCNGIQPFQPFEVVTHLEDRRNDYQMHCSKLLVSSACETLFKESFMNTYKYLPGLEFYDDMTIVCTFYPSSILELRSKSAKGSSLRLRQSLVWKTGKPTIHQRMESPVFNLKKSKWTLLMTLTKNMRYQSSNAYKICLRNEMGIQSFQPFEVETSIQERISFSQFQCSRLTVSSNSETLYNGNVNDIHEKLPGLKHDEYIVIICVFSQSSELEFGEKIGKDVTLTLECRRQSENCFDDFIEENVTERYSTNQSQACRFFSDFGNLSKDFDFLLDSRFMTDIRLKCGEDVIPAHKAILAVRSVVFSAMLQNKMVEEKNGTIEIKDIEPSVLREFLKFLYCGKISIDVSEDMLCKLYTTSHEYAVQCLQKLCSCYMTRNLNLENFTKFLIVAHAHKDQELIDAVAGFIKEKPELLVSDIWVNFSKEFPKLSNDIYRTYFVHYFQS